MKSFPRTSGIPLHYVFISDQCVLKVMQITIYLGVVKHVTEVSTGLLNACPVVNFTHVIHVYFDTRNVLSKGKWDTLSRSLELLFFLPLVMINSVVPIILKWVFLMVVHSYPRFRTVMFIFRSDCIPTVIDSTTSVLTQVV